jgi:hypothetical protein
MILASTLLSLSTVYAMDDQAPAQKIRPLIQISQDTAGSKHLSKFWTVRDSRLQITGPMAELFMKAIDLKNLPMVQCDPQQQKCILSQTAVTNELQRWNVNIDEHQISRLQFQGRTASALYDALNAAPEYNNVGSRRMAIARYYDANLYLECGDHSGAAIICNFSIIQLRRE